MTTTLKFCNSRINLDITSSFSFIFLIYHLTTKSVHPEQQKGRQQLSMLGYFFWKQRTYIYIYSIYTHKKL